MKFDDKEYQARYRAANKSRRKAWEAANPNYQRDYARRRYKSDPVYKLKLLLRGRLNMALKIGQKAGSAVKDLGCSIIEFKAYIESKFQPGMTWENRTEWHIDHIIPLSAFDLTDRKQLLRACHYTNLQPLWAKENYSKHDKII